MRAAICVATEASETGRMPGKLGHRGTRFLVPIRTSFQFCVWGKSSIADLGLGLNVYCVAATNFKLRTTASVQYEHGLAKKLDKQAWYRVDAAIFNCPPSSVGRARGS